MQFSSESSSQFFRPGYFAQVTLVLMKIRDTLASGRLSIRNTEQAGLAHLYFRNARLVHVTGTKSLGEAVLQDVLSWSRANIRFDQNLLVSYEDLTWQQAEVFTRWLVFLEMHGRLHGISQMTLQGLTHSLTATLPGKPVALPQEIEYYEEYELDASQRQLQRLSEGVGQFVHRAILRGPREPL